LHFRLQLFKCAYHGLRRTLMQPCRQLIQLAGGTDGISLHAAVVEIPDPPRHANVLSMFGYEPTETDALYPAGYQPASGRVPVFIGQLLLQWICSETGATAMAAGTASIAFLTAAQRLWS